jgi:hypothetical protein
MRALLSVNRFWGIINHGWVPLASFVSSSVMVAIVGACWLVMGRSRKRSILGFQVRADILVFAVVSAMLYMLPLRHSQPLRGQPGTSLASD